MEIYRLKHLLFISVFKLGLTALIIILISVVFDADAQVCGTSGLDGPQNSVPPINTYYPLSSSTTLPFGSKSITLEAVPSDDPLYGLSYGVTQIRSGDLILIIQMQDATFNSDNSNLYGSGRATGGTDGWGGTGYTDLGTSGKFEYVVATSNVPLTGGLLTFRGAGAGSGCVNTYTNADFTPTSTRGQQRFQVVRVPQYSTLVLNADITTPPYNGSVGGLIAFDVAGTMNFNGFIVDASERGFRGGYGPVASSGLNTNSVYAVASTSTASVGKGEGIAGTPRYMWDGFNQVDIMVEGLPGGSYGRGAPANAGGGGNDHNAGGGGGGNGGFGGIGGRGWQGANGHVNPLNSGGRPGSSIPRDFSRLIMGGGGGGGDANNALSGVKGGVGGGIILVNVEKIEGAGVIKSNGGAGQAGVSGPNPDGAGGGGAGGSIFVRSLAASPGAILTLEAKGGAGGNTLNDGGNEHGPGGGGGGGLIYTQVPSAVINTDVQKGVSGKANDGSGSPHGAEDGLDGDVQAFTTINLPTYLQGGGSICYPALDVTLTELNAGPGGSRNAGTTATYIFTVKNNIGGGNAGEVKFNLLLPFGFSLSNVTAALTGDAAGPSAPAFTPGAEGNISFGSYNISPGDEVTLTLTVNIAANVPGGIYHASGQASYLDPTRTILDAFRNITAINNPFTGSNTTYETGGLTDVPGSNYNGDLVTYTSEDVYINSPLTVEYCNAIINGGFELDTPGEYEAPDYLGRWGVVNTLTDKVKIVTQSGLQGALIRNRGTEHFSLQQTITSVKPSTTYTLTFDYRNWIDGACTNPANSNVQVDVLDANTQTLIAQSLIYQSNTSPTIATLDITTLATTNSLIIKIYDPGSPNPACGAFIDNISISSSLSVQIDKTEATCNVGNDGSLTISSLSGAGGPYKISYSYNGGAYSVPVNSGAIPVTAPSYVISNLVAGNYTVRITDENNCETITSETITQTNCNPVAQDDPFTGNEDLPLSGTVGGNDSDPDGDPLTFTLVTNPENGTVILNPDGTFVFTPNPGWSGTTSFDYEACDAEGLCSTATVTITIDPVNDPPVAQDDPFTGTEDSPLTGTVGLNDSDPEGGPLTFTLVTNPENGTVTLNPDGTFVFTPNPGWSGTTSFDYEACDAEGLCSTATVTTTVEPINDSPVAENDPFTGNEDLPLTGTVGGNDSDPDGDPLTFTLVTNPGNGTVILNPDGTFVFTPNPGWSGTTSFDYEVCDAGGLCSRATVTITIDPVNDPPVAQDDPFTGTEDSPLTGTVGLNDSDPDGDPLTFTLVTNPENGTVISNPVGTFVFTPNPGWSGATSFDYEVCDAEGLCSRATVTITVESVNDPPVAQDDPFTGTEDSPLTGTVGLNDSDPDGDPLTFTLVTNPENGTVILNPVGTFVFTPNPGWSGATSFDYEVCDAEGLCSRATVTITVESVNDPPVAQNDVFVIPAGAGFNGDVSPNDFDPDKDTLTFNLVVLPQHGELIFKEDGSFVYIPENGYFGPDEFTYIVCDLAGECSEATVDLTIKPAAIVSLTPTFSRIAEGNTVRITAVLTEPLTEDIEITLAYSGDAENARDYVLSGNFVTIKIPAGQTSTSQNFTVGALIDDVNEKDEHVLVAISRVSASNVKIGSGADVTIIDVYPPAKEVRDEEEDNVNTTIKPDPLLSPNGDGQGNEQFMIENILQFPDNEVLIFNRWGNEVFRVNNYDNAGRSFQGIANTGLLTNMNKNLPEGVYYYMIYTVDISQVKRLNKGYLILKR